MQAYPQARGSDSDLLVVNEIAAHSSLQLLPGAGPSPGSVNIAQLLGTMDMAVGGQVEIKSEKGGAYKALLQAIIFQ